MEATVCLVLIGNVPINFGIILHFV